MFVEVVGAVYCMLLSDTVSLSICLSLCHLPGSEGGMNGGGFQTLQNISNDVQHFNKNGKFKTQYLWALTLY